MINHNKKCNNLTGKEWLQNSFSIWRELDKNRYNDYAIETWNTTTGGFENAECVLK